MVLDEALVGEGTTTYSMYTTLHGIIEHDLLNRERNGYAPRSESPRSTRHSETALRSAVEPSRMTRKAPIGAMPATLKIRQKALAHSGVLGGAIPHTKRVFLAVRRDPQRDDEAVIAEMHASSSVPPSDALE